MKLKSQSGFQVHRNFGLQEISWLSNKTGETYRLLTVSEWEYAVRANSSSRFHWGTDLTKACQFGNVPDRTIRDSKRHNRDFPVRRLADANQYDYDTWTPFSYIDCNDGYLMNAPVGRFLPNKFGLHDMIGNVDEWVQDCYEASRAPPTSGSADEGGRCRYRILRGGESDALATSVRSAFRTYNEQHVRYYQTGFRVARDVSW